MTETATRVSPSPSAPDAAERAAWDRLSRDEQIARYRAYLAQPDCDGIVEATMADILQEARAGVTERRG